MGIPASGKSSFYQATFFHTHVRVSLDLLKTRHKEKQFFTLGLGLQQKMVIDNTNVTKSERALYIAEAKAHKFKVIGYYFESHLATCLRRNEQRAGKSRIAPVGIMSRHKHLELPRYEEGQVGDQYGAAA